MAAKTSDWRPGPTVCRCCLAEGCYKDISTEYFWMGKREVYAEMLTDTLNVSIGFSKSGGPNSNSRLICEPCISRLRDASDFKRQVLECEKTFMQHLDPGSTSVQKELELALEEVKIERVKQEKPISDDEDFDDGVDFVVDNADDDDDDLDDQPLMKLATKVPKKEVDLLALLDSTKVTVKRKATASTKTKEPPVKKAKKREIVIKPSASKPSVSAPKTDKKKKGLVKVEWQVKENHFGDARDNALILIQCSNMCPFKFSRNAFSCLHCFFKTPDFDRYIRHIRLEHTKNILNRVKVLFNKRNNPVLKAEVTNLICELCHESMSDISTLFEHLIAAHGKPLKHEYSYGIVPYLLSDGFKCADCGVIFDRFMKLNAHMRDHYPYFVCPKCGLGFLSRISLISHSSTHAKKTLKHSNRDGISPEVNKSTTSKRNVYRNKCPYCSESFKQYAERLKHMNNVHKMNINYPCTLCAQVFDTASIRSKHVRRIHMKEKNVLCTVCDSKFFNLTDLKLHMLKHSGERKHQCHVCSKAFARRATLMDHMRIHKNDRRFVCGLCCSDFVQRCSLKSHMKTHHPDYNITTRKETESE